MGGLSKALKKEGADSSEKINVLVVGSGGREHALLWKLGKSSAAGDLYIAPGNGGTSAHNVNIGAKNIEDLAKFAREHNCFTVVGAEQPLSLGIVDYFRKNSLLVFGPTVEQAKVETSKSYVKTLMVEEGIPTAAFRTFNSSKEAISYAKSKGGNVVVKADGLADGKGVFVCSSLEEAKQAIVSILDEGRFGESGKTILIEDKLGGRELSVFALCDGKDAVYIGSAVDYKRVFDGGKGPNTGGMGGYSPAKDADPELIDLVMKKIVHPVVKRTGFAGFLYTGLMITEQGPMVIEFNARFGDPEAQEILPRMKLDLLKELYSVAKGDGMRTRKPEQILRDVHATCVVMCSEGYPFNYKDKLGREIHGAYETSEGEDTIIFNAGTKAEGKKLLTSGGRVLCVVGLGPTHEEATKRAYERVSKISWEGEQHRSDVGRSV